MTDILFNSFEIWSSSLLVKILGLGIFLANTPPCAINHSLQQEPKKATSNLTNVE